MLHDYLIRPWQCKRLYEARSQTSPVQHLYQGFTDCPDGLILKDRVSWIPA